MSARRVRSPKGSGKKFARRKSASKSKPARSRGRRRLTQEAVAAEKARGPGGSSRRGLFWRPPSRPGQGASAFTQTMRFLPAMEERGPDASVRPFFLIGQHWIQRTNDEGEEYSAGITCTDFMREEQPTAWEKYKNEKVDAATENKRCLFCEALDALCEEDEDGDREWDPCLPLGRYGNDPGWIRRYSHNFAILLPREYYEQGDEEQDTLVKIYPAPRSVKDGLYSYLDKKQFFDLFEDETGWDVEVERYQRGRGPWNYRITPEEQCSIWYENWEEEMPDLEMVSPNWMTRKEALEWMEEAHPNVLKAAGVTSWSKSSTSSRRQPKRSDAAQQTGRSKPRSSPRSTSSRTSSRKRPAPGKKKGARRKATR